MDEFLRFQMAGLGLLGAPSEISAIGSEPLAIGSASASGDPLLPAGPLAAAAAHEPLPDDLLGLLPRHLLISPTHGRMPADLKGGAAGVADAPAHRVGDSDRRVAALQLAKELLGAGASDTAAAGSAEGNGLAGGVAADRGNTRRMLAFLSARGSAALAAAAASGAGPARAQAAGPAAAAASAASAPQNPATAKASELWPPTAAAAGMGPMLPATSSATSLLPTSQQQKTLPDLPPVGATAPQPSASLHHHTAREAAQLLPASAPIPAPEHWSVRNGVAGSADGSTGLSASDLYALGYSQAPLALPAALPGLPAAGQPTSSAAMAAMAAYAAWGWAAHARAPPGLLPPAYSLPASYSQLQHGASPYEHLALSTGLSSLDEGGASSGMGAAAVRASSSLPPAPTISRNLWLGNVMVADSDVVTRLFRPFGPIESVRVFAGRTYAFVNYVSEESAAAAKVALEMQVLPELTSAAPLLVRFQVPPEGYATRRGVAQDR